MTADERRVLLLSDTPPDGTGGRAERFRTRREQLADHGWTVSIAHVTEPYVLGFPLAVARLALRARREDVDVVNSVNNPFHLHAIGFLVSLLSGARWLAEFRDPLVTNPDLQGDPLLPLRRFIEWFAVHVADHVVWGDGIQVPERYYEDRYPDAADRITKLPFAGYVAAEFAAAEPVEYDGFTVTYAGSFYEGWIEPYDFLRGLARYVERREEGTDGLTVQFYGDWSDEYGAAAADLGVADAVEHHPFVPHEEIVPVLKGSDVLLYLGGTDERNARNVPSKVMDYVGARRPILALAPPSFRVVEFVESNGFGTAVDPDDPGAIADALERFERGAAGVDAHPETYERFTRSRKTERLAAVLDGLVG